MDHQTGSVLESVEGKISGLNKISVISAEIMAIKKLSVYDYFSRENDYKKGFERSHIQIGYLF
jgi:hypothetical protein